MGTSWDDGECPGCGGTDGACSCFDDADDDNLFAPSAWAECHLHNGSCGKAGSEECDWDCPNSWLLT